MALLLAQARNIPQAHGALVAGRWERTRWEGVELSDKVLGIIGLGRIGKLVAQRALAFGMHLVAYDPFVSPDRARQLSVELCELDELFSRSDFVTLHLAKTPDTIGLVGADLLARAKPGLRIVNVARGGIIDEDALAAAIGAGTVAGAALDVFAVEPTTRSPLFDLDSVVVTPHLGASTREAQDKAGETIAQQVLLALDDEFVPFAVNVKATEAAESVRPFLPLAEQLGAVYALLAGELPPVIDIEFQGEIGGYDNQITELSAVKGILGQISDQPVSYVNALDVAKDRGIEIRSVSSAVSKDYVNVITVRGGGRSIAGTLVGLRGTARIVMVDDHLIDMAPAPHMVVVRNEDRPGVIAAVGAVLASFGVNIDELHVGRSPQGVGALMVISVGRSLERDELDALARADGITSVRGLDLVDLFG